MANQIRLTMTSLASPERVFDFLANPRNLMVANYPGAAEARSEGEGAVGSWAVLDFANIRVRVTYTAWDRPSHLAATLEYSGRGSNGRRDSVDYELSASPDGGTVISMEGATEATISIPLVSQIARSIAIRRLRQKLEAIN